MTAFSASYLRPSELDIIRGTLGYLASLLRGLRIPSGRASSRLICRTRFHVTTRFLYGVTPDRGRSWMGKARADGGAAPALSLSGKETLMASQFQSQASNFLDALSGSVEPRTGLYS